MVLTPCDTLWGHARTIERDPTIAEYADCLYVPFQANESWGVFDASGRILEGTVDWRTAERHTNQQIPHLHLDGDAVRTAAPEPAYVYGGRINLHFGHFLINTLSRFWPLLARRRDRLKFLCHDTNVPAAWFAHPFASRIFGALGLTPEDFVTFDAPTRIERLIVPHTSVAEQFYAHRVFGLLCRRLGVAIAGDMGDASDRAPIYLSKTRLAHGVSRFVNEQALADRLAERGVEIVHPETLDLADQIRLFAGRRTVLGCAGSAFHTSIFAPPRGRARVLLYTPHINSNFVLLDRLSGLDVQYLYAEGSEIVPNPGGSPFLTEVSLRDPVETADALLATA